MQKIFTCLLLASLMACSKDKNENDNDSLVGKWQLTETRISMGEGNPPWRPAEFSYTVEFRSDGSFIDSHNNIFTGYERYHQDSVLLFNAGKTKVEVLGIEELTSQRLTYSATVPGIGYCGSIPGYKYKRLTSTAHQ